MADRTVIDGGNRGDAVEDVLCSRGCSGDEEQPIMWRVFPQRDVVPPRKMDRGMPAARRRGTPQSSNFWLDDETTSRLPSPLTSAIMRRARGLRVRPLLPTDTSNGSRLTLAGFFPPRHLCLLCHPSTGHCEPWLVAHSLSTVETAQLVEQIRSIRRGCRL